MKLRIAIALGLFASLLATSAFADEGIVESAAPKKMSAGLQLDLVPVGSLGQNNMSYDAGFAYALGGTFDYAVTPYLSVGVAPRFVFNVIDKNAPSGIDPAKELDLRARARAHFAVASKLEAYGFVAPGYSVIMMPSQANLDNPSGLVLALGAGVTYDLSAKLFLAGELGYQLGFQSVSVAGHSADVTTDFLSIGLGAGARF